MITPEIIRCHWCGKTSRFKMGSLGGMPKMFGFERIDYCSDYCFFKDLQDYEEWAEDVSQEEFNLRYALAISITKEQNRKYALKKKESNL